MVLRARAPAFRQASNQFVDADNLQLEIASYSEFWLPQFDCFLRYIRRFASLRYLRD